MSESPGPIWHVRHCAQSSRRYWGKFRRALAL
nr:MAG TPA: hypothetical protein [Caudoviricetes sp.]